jgi:hypothetical protein
VELELRKLAERAAAEEEADAGPDPMQTVIDDGMDASSDDDESGCEEDSREAATSDVEQTDDDDDVARDAALERLIQSGGVPFCEELAMWEMSQAPFRYAARPTALTNWECLVAVTAAAFLAVPQICRVIALDESPGTTVTALRGLIYDFVVGQGSHIGSLAYALRCWKQFTSVRPLWRCLATRCGMSTPGAPLKAVLGGCEWGGRAWEATDVVCIDLDCLQCFLARVALRKEVRCGPVFAVSIGNPRGATFTVPTWIDDVPHCDGDGYALRVAVYEGASTLGVFAMREAGAYHTVASYGDMVTFGDPQSYTFLIYEHFGNLAQDRPAVTDVYDPLDMKPLLRAFTTPYGTFTARRLLCDGTRHESIGIAAINALLSVGLFAFRIMELRPDSDTVRQLQDIVSSDFEMPGCNDLAGALQEDSGIEAAWMGSGIPAAADECFSHFLLTLEKVGAVEVLELLRIEWSAQLTEGEVTGVHNCVTMTSGNLVWLPGSVESSLMTERYLDSHEDANTLRRWPNVAVRKWPNILAILVDNGDDPWGAAPARIPLGFVADGSRYELGTFVKGATSNRADPWYFLRGPRQQTWVRCTETTWMVINNDPWSQEKEITVETIPLGDFEDVCDLLLYLNVTAAGNPEGLIAGHELLDIAFADAGLAVPYTKYWPQMPRERPMKRWAQELRAEEMMRKKNL